MPTLYMQPKIQILTMGAFQDLTAEEQSNQTTADYHHTYFNADNLNLQSLMAYPTDAKLAMASDHALKKAEQLLATLGIDAKAILAQYVEPMSLVAKQKKASSTSQPPHTLHQLLKLYESVHSNQPMKRISLKHWNLQLLQRM